MSIQTTSLQDEAINLIYGRWRSQILYAGVELGLFDQLSGKSFQGVEVLASILKVSSPFLYRLMRALASIGFLTENDSRGFATTELGSLFQSDHPETLRHRVLTAEGPEHYAIWRHLPGIVRDGKQDGFVREFGASAFEYARSNERYRRAFDQAMTGHSAFQSSLVVEALRDCDLSTIETICDIGGGHGHLMCALLTDRPHLKGIVFDLPEVFSDASELWASKLGLRDRCSYEGGDMFETVPRADAYTLKMILHNWSDPECIEILSAVRKCAPPRATIFVIDHLVPAPSVAHFAKLFDIHMLCWGSGRERTEAECVELLTAAGWTHTATWYPKNHAIGVVGACLIS
jgi:O-methyltransferase domain/Dimerisation domain